MFRDRFLIADVKMKAAFPTERWFWFDPPFHPNRSALLHRQPDDVWRIDFQLGWDADPVAERRPENVIPRVRAMLGETVEFELEWCSVYTFACLRMDTFRHGRVLFTGDAAHGVSPFGARGANSGVQDAENLAWKLALVLAGNAPDRLLDTYASEREHAADENISASTRATDFITPKSQVSRTFRDAALKLAKDCAFARPARQLRPAFGACGSAWIAAQHAGSGCVSRPDVARDRRRRRPDHARWRPGLAPGSGRRPLRLSGLQRWRAIASQDHRRPPRHLAGSRSRACDRGRDGARGALGAERSEGRRGQRRPACATLRCGSRHGLSAPSRPARLRARWRQFDVNSISSAVARATCNA